MSYSLYAFGSNGEGQLGVGTVSDKLHTPTKAPKMPPCDHGYKAIRGGGNHTLILTASGAVYGAGLDRSGQLGSQAPLEDEDENSGRIVEFKDLHLDVAFCAAAWESSAYILTPIRHSTTGIVNSGVYTEGRSLHGELGRGDRVDSYSVSGSIRSERLERVLDVLPTTLPGPAIDFAAGMYHYLAVLEDGSVYGWGRARSGQLGKTDLTHYSTPSRIEDIPFPARKVVCGQNFTYLVGNPASGEHIVLGDDKHGIQSKKPESVKGWKEIGATWNAIFVLLEDGTLMAWGKSNLWELVPPNLPKLKNIATGSDHVIALTEKNTVLAWGWAVHGNCGNTEGLKKPLSRGYVTGQFNEMEFDGEVVQIGAGYSTSFVVVKDGDGS
ncbi:RCC1/BLIP-II [Westerdykella ornata]|uniref:RCC1/BLIP-II n=1 Tax=Westerdykella ornata TaxID=318751 RepID=A0A6A6JU11_WESOR|nr:RCC1/BLIP-II [Westerdykella ornata]KAF2280091.1 RCC1/BLIP-II [Westerdykella ornata]